VRLFRDLSRLPEEFRGGAVSIGNFDGVHLGHARIIECLLDMARHESGPSVAFTFDPHPVRLLRPDAAPTPLVWTQRKAELLGQLGVDAVVAYPTDRALLHLSAREFFDQIVLDQLGARAMVEGPNFFFGRHRQGSILLLSEFCSGAGVSLGVIEPVEMDGEIISSSRIRIMIGAGWVEHARRLLGRPYRVRGTVVRGESRGAKLGYPTANIERVDTLLPADGIYAGLGWIAGDDSPRPAAVSLGPNPTFDEEARKVEIHLIDYEGSLYEQTVELDFLTRLRDIERFDSAEQLVAQMDSDVTAARRIAKDYLAEK